jgi:hypothetical protein
MTLPFLSKFVESALSVRCEKLARWNVGRNVGLPQRIPALDGISFALRVAEQNHSESHLNRFILKQSIRISMQWEIRLYLSIPPVYSRIRWKLGLEWPCCLLIL